MFESPNNPNSLLPQPVTTRPARQFECWNPYCPYYAGHGQRLNLNQVWLQDQNWYCRVCRSPVRQAPAAETNANALAGLAGGALVGVAFGGAPGALIGALVGLILATSSNRQGGR